MPTYARRRLAKLALHGALLATSMALAACGGPTAEPTAAPTAVVAPTEAPSEVTLLLVAKDLLLDAGACTTLEWESSNARQVYLDGRGVDPVGSEEVCPTETTAYVLKAVDAAGAEKSSEVTVEVAAAPEPTAAPTEPPAPTRPPVTAAPAAPTATPAPTAASTAATLVEFWSDRAQLDEETSCTSVRWRTSGIQEVHLEREGSGKKAVGGEGEEKNICIGRGEKVRYFLIVKHLDGREEKKEILIQREN